MLVRGCDGEAADEMVVRVDLDVGLVAVVDLSVFDAEAAVLVHVPSLLLGVVYLFAALGEFFLFAVAFLSQVSFDEAGVLDDAFFDLVAFGVELPLQLIPDQGVDLGFFEAVSDFPDGGEVWDLFGESEEVSEAESVVALEFQLRVGESVPCLEQHGADDDEFIGVRAATDDVVIVEDAFDEWDERLPVDLVFHRFQSVAKAFDFLVVLV